MSEKTKIAWCDSTLNFWEGCTKVSAGCANCYAEARDKRFTGGIYWRLGRRRHSKSALKDAFKLNSQPWICDACGMAHANPGQICMTPGCDCETRHRRRIFSLSLGDWLDDEVPIGWLAEMLDCVRQCDQVTWILCTKRPENWYSRLLSVCACQAATGTLRQNEDFFLWVDDWLKGRFPANVILLASVENQAMADKRIPELIKIPAMCRGLSLEPLLGPVDLSRPFDGPQTFPMGRGLNWLIIGGESGHCARPCNVSWIGSLVERGKSFDVATFVKQLGSYSVTDESTPDGWPVGTILETNPACCEDAVVKLLDKKGGDPSEWPTYLRIQQWPKGF